jgi:hypothetical protein
VGVSPTSGATSSSFGSLDDSSRRRARVRRVKPEWIFHLAAHGAYSWETTSTDPRDERRWVP